MDPFLLIGLMILLGFIGARGADVIKIPWVVGYIAVGVLIGSSGLNLVSQSKVDSLEWLSVLALALIGFTIGGELRIRDMRTLGVSIVTITIFEALGAFVLVGITLKLITGSTPLALLFGALASATAPAATVDVLWQYRSKGPLTTTLFGVVGLDDAAALIIYAFASSIARVLLGTEAFSLESSVFRPLEEIGGALLLGGLVGVALHYVLQRVKEDSHVLILTLGCLFLVVGIAQSAGLSLILSAMALGFTLVNLPRAHRGVFESVQRFNPVVFLLFFLLVGARLQVGLVWQLGAIGLAYIVMRVAGKMSGAWIGATLSKAPETVRKYLGLCLLSQAGVAVGLAIDASHTFARMGEKGAEIGTLAITVIAATTFIYQILGPPMTKVAIFKAGEVPEEMRG
ncbi:MAG: hypothetical protein Kow0056_17380 [Coriobacteriia bacterium]